MAIAVTRKHFLIGAAAVGTAGLILRPVKAAGKHIIKFGIDLPAEHPTTKHVMTAADQIRNLTNGDVTIEVIPSSQLGDDTHMLSALRSGVTQMMGIGDNILATLVPSAAIDNIGFAFKDTKTAWDALDGAVGDIVCAEIERIGLHPMRAHLG
jgi:TRAP-type C4-dicarboxylate transport system substrate-binding protein